MLMNINLTPILEAIIALLAAVITCVLIPWIKSRTSESQQRLIRDIIRALVFAAEQIYGNGHGKEKLQYVCEKLREKGYEVDLAQIEAAVGEFINGGVQIEESTTIEEETDDGYDLPPLEEWPLEMIVDFCRLNGIPCDGCQTKEEFINAITQGGGYEPPGETEAVLVGSEEPEMNDSEEPESRPEDEE